jgi:hypothetical protein
MAFAPANFDSPRFILADPAVNCFFFGPDWFPWLGQAGNDYFASFPLHDTPKPAGVFFFLVGSLNPIFCFGYI